MNRRSIAGPRRYYRVLTVSLSGRTQGRPARRERRISQGARGAPPQACHGPLQALVRRLAVSIKVVSVEPRVDGGAEGVARNSNAVPLVVQGEESNKRSHQ